jgi:DNA-binding GntR family transcriptional regulator
MPMTEIGEMSILMAQEVRESAQVRRDLGPNRGSVSPSSGRVTKQEQLAARFLERIEGVNGEEPEWPPGTLLPSEAKLIESERESRFAVRGALNILRQAGFVESRTGVGTIVITRDTILIDAAAIQDLDVREQADRGDEDALSASVAAAGHHPTKRFRLEIVSGREEPEVAQFLGVAEGEPLTLRESRWSVNGQPRIIESGYFPEHIASRTELSRLRMPEDVAEGTTLYLARNGFPDLCHFDHIDCRPPSKEERDFLETEQWVLVQLRVTLDRLGGEPIRVIRFVYRGDRYKLRTFVAGRGNPKFEIKEKA